jgi:Leucine-rich repeat (LRR) protein
MTIKLIAKNLLPNIDQTPAILGPCEDKTRFQNLFYTAWECAGAPETENPIAFGERVFLDQTGDLDCRKQAMITLLCQNELRTDGRALLEWTVEQEDEIEQRIEARNRILCFKNNTAVRLDLADLNLTSLPDIFHLPPFKERLQEFYLQNNRLTTLPESISHLKNLETLGLDTNALTEIPNLSGLPGLKYLTLKYNQLKEVPSWLYTWDPEASFNIEENPLTTLPQISKKSITYTQMFYDMKGLTELGEDNLLHQAISNLSEGNPDQAMDALQKLIVLHPKIKHDLFKGTPHLLLKDIPTEDILLKLRSILIKLRLGDGYSLLNAWVAQGEEGENRRAAQKAIEAFVLNPAAEDDIALDLSEFDLKSIPDIFYLPCFQSIVFLDLSENKLTIVPQSIGALHSLKKLYLVDNQLTSLPNSIQNCINLTTLCLSDNPFTSLPEPLKYCTRLIHLEADNNLLETLPEWITSFSSLQYLDLIDNSLTGLPDAIGKLPALRHLDVSDNQLDTLPFDIIYLASLTDLILSGNTIRHEDLWMLQGREGLKIEL